MPKLRFALAACGILCGVAASVMAAPPNVIVILADDLGYGDLACYGHSEFKTPHLDRMAAEGARLTQFNTPTPFCAPTRAALLTGRYPFRCGMPSNPAPDGGPVADMTHLPETEITLGQLFQKAGYATTIVGKWHLGHAKPDWLPTQRGFDSYFGIPYSNDMRPVKLFEGTRPDAEFPLDQTQLTRRYTDRAIAFIEQNRSRPFFLYLPHAMPHKPLAASEKFYKQTQLGLYGEVIAELDAGIGQLFAKLKELRLDDNTFVLFTSDNGPWYGGSAGGLRGMKGSTYEGGHRVPCIARWPGKIPAGNVSHELAVTMDIFPTVLRMAGIDCPRDRVIDGRDLMPLFTSPTAKSGHSAMVGAQGPRLAFVRDGRWKLHVLPAKDPFLGASQRVGPWIDPRGPDGKTIVAPLEQPQPNQYPGMRTGVAAAAMQLFDLKNDPAEQIDVAKEHPDVVARLKEFFDEAMK